MDWWFIIDGIEHGPYDSAQIAAWIRAGDIAPTVTVRNAAGQIMQAGPAVGISLPPALPSPSPGASPPPQHPQRHPSQIRASAHIMGLKVTGLLCITLGIFSIFCYPFTDNLLFTAAGSILFTTGFILVIIARVQQ